MNREFISYFFSLLVISAFVMFFLPNLNGFEVKAQNACGDTKGPAPVDYCSCPAGGCPPSNCPGPCGVPTAGTYGRDSGVSCGPKQDTDPYSPTFGQTIYKGAWCSVWEWCCSVCSPGDCGTAGPPVGPGCTQSGWANQGCGAGGCAADQMYQTQTVNPAACAATSQCIASAICTGTPSSCDFDVSNLTINGTGATATQTLSNIVVVGGSTISSVAFTSLSNSVATVTSPDLALAYRTTVTATGIGNTSVLVRANMNNGEFCQKTFNVTVNNPAGWFQMIDGDITSAKGNISNPIPATCLLPGCKPFLSIDPPPNSPGLAVAAGNISSGAGGPS